MFRQILKLLSFDYNSGVHFLRERLHSTLCCPMIYSYLNSAKVKAAPSILSDTSILHVFCSIAELLKKQVIRKMRTVKFMTNRTNKFQTLLHEYIWDMLLFRPSQVIFLDCQAELSTTAIYHMNTLDPTFYPSLDDFRTTPAPQNTCIMHKDAFSSNLSIDCIALVCRNFAITDSSDISGEKMFTIYPLSTSLSVAKKICHHHISCRKLFPKH